MPPWQATAESLKSKHIAHVDLHQKDLRGIKNLGGLPPELRITATQAIPDDADPFVQSAARCLQSSRLRQEVQKGQRPTEVSRRRNHFQPCRGKCSYRPVHVRCVGYQQYPSDADRPEKSGYPNGTVTGIFRLLFNPFHRDFELRHQRATHGLALRQDTAVRLPPRHQQRQTRGPG